MSGFDQASPVVHPPHKNKEITDRPLQPALRAVCLAKPRANIGVAVATRLETQGHKKANFLTAKEINHG